jgi:hypothetical protein
MLLLFYRSKSISTYSSWEVDAIDRLVLFSLMDDTKSYIITFVTDNMTNYRGEAARETGEVGEPNARKSLLPENGNPCGSISAHIIHCTACT